MVDTYRGLDKEEVSLSTALKASSPEPVHTRPDPSTCSYEIRPFSFLHVYDGIDYKKIDPHCVFKDTITLEVVPWHFHGYRHREALKSHMWTNGHLMCSKTSMGRSSQILANVVPRQFEPQGVLQCLNYCNKHHKKLCHTAVEFPNLKLIDCYDRTIILAPHHTRHVALSYVWGTSKDISPPQRFEGSRSYRKSVSPP